MVEEVRARSQFEAARATLRRRHDDFAVGQGGFAFGKRGFAVGQHGFAVGRGRAVVWTIAPCARVADRRSAAQSRKTPPPDRVERVSHACDVRRAFGLTLSARGRRTFRCLIAATQAGKMPLRRLVGGSAGPYFVTPRGLQRLRGVFRIRARPAPQGLLRETSARQSRASSIWII